MDNVYKYLKHNSKRIFSIMLAFAIFTENPLYAYASTTATPSNITETDSPTTDPKPPTFPVSSEKVELELEDDSFDELLSGANCIDDFDPATLVPLSPDQVKLLQDASDQESHLNDDLVVNAEIDAQIVAETAIAVKAVLAIMFAIGCAAVTVANAQKLSDQIDAFASDSFVSDDFTYMANGQTQKVTLTQLKFINLKNKLANALSGNKVSVSLSQEDKEAFAYATYKLSKSGSNCVNYGYGLTCYDASQFNIKAINGFKYYYFYQYDNTAAYKGNQYGRVLYTPQQADLGLVVDRTLRLYYRNAATADYGFSMMKVHDSEYRLSNTSGLYEYNSGKESSSLSRSTYSEFYNLMYSLPFPIASLSDKDKVFNYIPTKDVLLFDYTYKMRIGSLNMLMNLASASISSDVDSVVNSEKNVFVTTTGYNTAAGTVTDTDAGTDTGTDTKPGTDTGTSGGTTTSPDYSSSLTSIIGIITSILAGVSGIPDILSLFRLLPTTIKDSITDAITDSTFFRESLVYFGSIANGIDDVLGWDIDVWIDNAASSVTDAIDDWGSRWVEGLANLPSVDNLADIITRALEATVLSGTVVSIGEAIKLWNIDNYAEAVAKALEAALGTIGLGSLPSAIGSLKDAIDALKGLDISVNLDSLADILKEVLTALGLDSLLGALMDILSLLKTFSLTDVLDLIRALPTSIATALSATFTPPSIEEKKDDGSGFFKNLLNIFTLLILIVIALLILFTNCLKFIFNIYQIPASSALFNDDVLKGLNFLKSLEVTFPGTSAISVYDLLIACAYFVIFMSIIAMLRKKIDKIHV